MLIDASATITNGTLLQGDLIGTRLRRPGLDTALGAGRPTVLPVGPRWWLLPLVVVGITAAGLVRDQARG